MVLKSSILLAIVDSYLMITSYSCLVEYYPIIVTNQPVMSCCTSLRISPACGCSAGGLQLPRSLCAEALHLANEALGFCRRSGVSDSNSWMVPIMMETPRTSQNKMDDLGGTPQRTHRPRVVVRSGHGQQYLIQEMARQGMDLAPWI